MDRWEKYVVCKVGRYARVSSFFAHLGEEDVLRGWLGSGTIFFGWCNLRCVFCQSYETSQKGEGDEVEWGKIGDLENHLFPEPPNGYLAEDLNCSRAWISLEGAHAQ